LHTEDEEDLSVYDYSVEAPSYLGGSERIRRESSDYSVSSVNGYASQNLSRYMFQMEDDGMDDISPSVTARDRDSCLGSLPALIPCKRNQSESCLLRDHEEYTNKLLGTGDCDDKTEISLCSSSQCSSSSRGILYSSTLPVKKIGSWIKKVGRKTRSGANSMLRDPRRASF
jgi:hypothetical protein